MPEPTNGWCPTCANFISVTAASPDERLREADRAALVESIAQTERFRGGPCLCSDCVEKRADAEAAVDAVLAALAAADREKPDEPQHTQECQDAMFMHHAATGGDMECSCADREKPEPPPVARVGPNATGANEPRPEGGSK